MNILIYVLCGILTYGLSLYHYQTGWPNITKQMYKENLITSIVGGCCGYFGLIGFLLYWVIVGKKYVKLGLKFK